MMKLLRVTVLFAATVGLIVFEGREMSVRAASLSSQSGGSDAKADQQTGKPGIPSAFPPLSGLKQRTTERPMTDIIRTGSGRAAGSPKVQGGELTALVHYLGGNDLAVQAAIADSAPGHSSDLAKAGSALFQQNCAFCHGRDAAGGESGPDLTRSKLVLADKGGDMISDVVRNGRIEKKMPSFTVSDQELLSLVAFIHSQAKGASKPGGRRGVDVADLQTGDVEVGKRYFNGAGTCATCHSPTGDLAGVASRYQGLQLEERMLYPRDVKSRVTVTLPCGQSVTGILAYHDEFTVGLRDDNGTYRSWATGAVKYKVDAPVQAHVALFSKYTDTDIHNLMAYIQTLR